MQACIIVTAEFLRWWWGWDIHVSGVDRKAMWIEWSKWEEICTKWECNCYRLNEYVLPKVIYWYPNPQCGAIRTCGLWGMIRSWGWDPGDEISAFYKRDPRELSLPFHHLSKKMRIYEPRSRLSPGKPYITIVFKILLYGWSYALSSYCHNEVLSFLL